jgi:hypothetical protein
METAITRSFRIEPDRPGVSRIACKNEAREHRDSPARPVPPAITETEEHSGG